jgi:hypothetical protein
VTSGVTWLPWEAAWREALYGERGFYRRAEGPAGHFRTATHAAPAVLAAALARLRGRAEWGVKLIADARALADAARRQPQGGADEAQPGGAGHAYVARKRRDRTAREQAQRLAREAAREVHTRLTAEASAATLLRPPSRELSGEAGETLLYGAYLVDSTRAEQFRTVASELGERQRERGMKLEVTGPWAPYSFVTPRPQ